MESKSDRGRFVQNQVDSWSPYIGQGYAELLGRVRKKILVRLPLLIVGFVGGWLSIALIGGNYSARMTIGLLILFAAITPLLLAAADVFRLGLRIQRDLETAGFVVKPGGPDLRTIEIFKYWSKRSGITSEDIIRVGNAVFGEVE